MTSLLFAALVSAFGQQASPPPLSLTFDYRGAEAILDALERSSLTDQAVDSLLAVPPVNDMVKNTMGFSPQATPEHFRQHIKHFVMTKTSLPGADRDWHLSHVWQGRAQIRALIAELKANERRVVDETLAQLGKYAPETGPLNIVVYFIAGGNSGGGPIGTTGMYANLQQANGDFGGVVSNLAHESYHVMQNAAWRRHPELSVFVDDRDRMSVEERLLTTTLAEGTANFAVDPRQSAAVGPAMQASRERYARNETPERIAENFALLDTLLAQLRTGRTTWGDAYRRGFAAEAVPTPQGNDARLYFVGYQMARAIAKYCGSSCVGALFEQPARAFFKQYIELYRRHPEIAGRFSPATEAFVLGLKREQIVPIVDHHQHLISPGTIAMLNSRRPPNEWIEPITAEKLIALLDAAGIQRAVVLSGAFTFAGHNFDPDRATKSEDEQAALGRAENDWTASEVSKYPTRLIAFCSFHPQYRSALDELRRCASNPVFKGVKFHLDESDIRLANPEHAEIMRRVFAEANRLKLPIAIHPANRRSEARATAEALVNVVLPAAPDVPVQIAHLSGGGAFSEAALSVYEKAVTGGGAVARNLIFDLTDLAMTAREAGPEARAVMERIAAAMRRIGLERMFYGSDPAVFGRMTPREGWAEFLRVMPLTEQEIRTIADNVAPYAR